LYPDDLKYLCCPASGAPLEIGKISATDKDGEILSGFLKTSSADFTYPISNGIPRFLVYSRYSESWDYKWTQIDKGKGLNYKVVDKGDLAYQIHDLFDRNSHDGRAYAFTRDNLVLDLGCGTGQYTWKLLEEYAPAKVIAMDLTRGVDVFRRIMLKNFPQYKRQILMVQASVFQMPFRDETFDYVLSLGVLMHTGDTLEAVKQACRTLKYDGHINFWIYASEPVPYEAREPNRNVRSLCGYFRLFLAYSAVWCWIHLFRKLPHSLVVLVVRLFSSLVWYRLSTIPFFGYLARFIFPTTMHSDFDYRFINNYDGSVNSWSDTWNEHELFPVLRECSIAIKGISTWRLGFWGKKVRAYYS
jgi:SAM-dependent methyltransferase